MAVLGAHRPIRPLGILLLAILVAAAPLAASLGSGEGWRSSIYEGNNEPGVGHKGQARGDFDPEGMWQAANDGSDGEPVRDRIYLDGVIDHFVHPHIPSPKPPETAPRNYGTWYMHAFLGTWRDCNGDGFIGDAVTGAIRYPATPRVDGGVCPLGSPYNDGVMVTEQLVIGPDARDLSTRGDRAFCPERTGGPSGDPAKTPRAKEDRGVLDGGDNVVCLGGSEDNIQDDLAKVWMDFGLPTDGPGTLGVSLFPFPDGTLRDTNGHFRYADLALQGQLSRATPLWPAPAEPGDPAPGNQCRETDDGLDVVATADNAQQALAGGSCSPVPNIAYFDLPVLGPVAWPGHLAEDRFNDSENPNRGGTPITEPFDQAGPDGETGTSDDCQLRSDVTAWDGEDDADPIRGYTLGETDLSAYLGPQDGGPSAEPTVDVLLYPVLFNVQRSLLGTSNTPCRGDGGTLGHPLEETVDLQPPIKARADAPFTFLMDAHFNPGTAPGGPAPQTQLCASHFGLIFGVANRCGGLWLSSEQYHSTNAHGLTEADPDVTESLIVTFYADVSFGPNAFDPIGDGPFGPDEVTWETPSWLQADPADMLPAGGDDAHRYGDEQCDEVNKIAGASQDVLAPDTVVKVASSWSCDRNDWVQLASLDCLDPLDELACYLLPKVGDPYDLRDIDCYDNDVAATGTTDTSGPLPSGAPAGSGLLTPGQDCDAIDPARLPDL